MYRLIYAISYRYKDCVWPNSDVTMVEGDVGRVDEAIKGVLKSVLGEDLNNDFLLYLCKELKDSGQVYHDGYYFSMSSRYVLLSDDKHSAEEIEKVGKLCEEKERLTREIEALNEKVGNFSKTPEDTAAGNVVENICGVHIGDRVYYISTRYRKYPEINEGILTNYWINADINEPIECEIDSHVKVCLANVSREYTNILGRLKKVSRMLDEDDKRCERWTKVTNLNRERLELYK